MKSAKLVGPSINVLSSVRGLGRYVTALKQLLDIDDSNHIAINPFFNLVGNPWYGIYQVKSKHKIAVVHDVIPLVYPSSFPVGPKGKVRTLINRVLLQAYDRIVTDSQTSKLDIVRQLGISANKISVAYPYSLMQSASPYADISHLPYNLKEKEYLVYVGDVNWNKNIVNMASAAIHANIKLVCVGMAFTKPVNNHPWLAPLREFLALSAQHPDIIVKTGFVDDQTLATLYKNALANVLISHDEGFGYSYVEAGYFNTPSILADRPIFHEISADKGALFVDPNNIQAISRQYLAMRDSFTRDKLGNDAFIHTSITYSKDILRKQWLDILDLL